MQTKHNYQHVYHVFCWKRLVIPFTKDLYKDLNNSNYFKHNVQMNQMTEYEGNGYMKVTACVKSVFYERPVGTFQLHEFLISASWILDFNFTNSRF
jgi:hypothetical protein